MPILPPEPMIHPIDLLDEGLKHRKDATEETDDIAVWWCLHTKPRQEKATARSLRRQNLAYFLPMITKERRTPQGRKTSATLPLFPNYVFFYGTEHDRLKAYQGQTLANILKVPDQERLEDDLQQTYRLLNAGLLVEPVSEFPVGSRVRITSGPLQGAVGTIIRRGNNDQFVSIVHFLGQGSMVEIQGWHLEQLTE